MSRINPDVWMSAADDVCAVLALDVNEYGESYYERAVYDMGLLAEHLPAGKHQSFFQSVSALKLAGRPVEYNGVIECSQGVVTIQWFYELISRATAEGGTVDRTITGSVFDANIGILRSYGERAALVSTLNQGASALQNGANTGDVVDSLMSRLAASDTEVMRDTSAGGAVARLELLLSEAKPDVVSTGIDWLDSDTNGLLPSQLWYLAGPYKSSKTRIAYNIALSTAEQGIPTAILSRENQETVIAAQLVCMLAVRWLSSRVPYDPTNTTYWISPTALIVARNTYKSWPKVKAQAIDAGIKFLAGLSKSLHIYDSTPTGGKLSDISSIRRVIQRDKRLYGGQKFILDHLGLVRKDGSIYERTAATSNDLQGLSREDSANPITLLVLAQLNEDTIKNGEGYQAGVKGGGDTSADADVLLTTRPEEIEKGTYYDDRTTLKVKFNRWGSSGNANTVYFHPGSGLILQRQGA